MKKPTGHGKELKHLVNGDLRPANNHATKLGWDFSSPSQVAPANTLITAWMDHKDPTKPYGNS